MFELFLTITAKMIDVKLYALVSLCYESLLIKLFANAYIHVCIHAYMHSYIHACIHTGLLE